MKHRLVEYLASQRGFTLFAIEANMPEAYRLNDYVLEGKGDPAALIAGMYFWTWNTEEVLAMVQWMRDYNQSGRGRIEFTGFDMQTPEVAMENVVRFLKQNDPQQLKFAEGTYGELRKARKGGGPGRNFAVATGSFPVSESKGKKIRYSGWIKTAGVTRDFAGLWWRADGKEGVLAFDNMQSSQIRGDTDWKRHEIVLDIPEQTVNINFGALLTGDGKAWFDDLQVEIDGRLFDPSGRFDLSFESGGTKGFFTSGAGYTVTIDEGVAKAGKKSLRMESTGTVPPGEKKEQLEVKPFEEIVAQMEGSRESYVKATSLKDAEWAIQNARLVLQHVQLDAGQVSRDESMAKNVKWILEQAPRDAKMVLWAHNGHVGRQWQFGNSMGGCLHRWYGKQQRVIGFTVGEGRYTAMVPKSGLRHDNLLLPPPTGSCEAYFRSIGLPGFILDLRQASKDDPASSWLTSPLDCLAIGAIATDAQFSQSSLCDTYDAIVYIDKTTASRPLKSMPGVR